jgi:hypothetical protein
MLSKSTLDLAHRIERSLARGYEEYLEACEQDRREGHRPHYCEHGKTQWVDYDNICGPCEDGVTMRDGVQRREFALDEAKRKEKAIRELLAAGFLVEKELNKVGVQFDLAPIWKRMTDILDSAYHY